MNKANKRKPDGAKRPLASPQESQPSEPKDNKGSGNTAD